jgi:hypothetical protein
VVVVEESVASVDGPAVEDGTDRLEQTVLSSVGYRLEQLTLIVTEGDHLETEKARSTHSFLNVFIGDEFNERSTASHR